MIDAENGFEFHHVGVACTDISAEVTRLAAVGYVPDGVKFEDWRQGVRGLFMGGQSPRLELLEPLGESHSGSLAPWLDHGIKLYHLAYSVRRLEDAIEGLRMRQARLMVPPTPAIAFGERKVAFLMLPNRLLVELISSE